MGAVALDLSGTVAAGASTGGVDVMLPGRVGDTPLIGCGVYADNEAGAVSMTGLGRALFELPSPRKLLMDWRPAESAVAAARVLRKVVQRIHGAAVLVLSPTDDSPFGTAPHMAAGVIGRDGRPLVRSRFAWDRSRLIE